MTCICTFHWWVSLPVDIVTLMIVAIGAKDDKIRMQDNLCRVHLIHNYAACRRCVFAKHTGIEEVIKGPTPCIFGPSRSG